MKKSNGDEVSNDLDFNAWDRNNKNHIQWVFQDDKIRKIPYSRARSKPSMNNFTATEWNTMSASQILFKYMPEGELETWIT